MRAPGWHLATAACMLATPLLAATTTNIPEPRIVGGTVVPQTVPWMTSLQARYSAFDTYGHMCGGSLVSPNLVMTAAHCIVNKEIGVAMVLSSNFRVALGGLQLIQPIDGTGFEFHFVTQVYCHPKYQLDSHDNDMCFLQLDVPSLLTPVPLNIPGPSVSEVAVAKNQAVGSMLTVYGWGATNPGNTNVISNDLQSVDVPVYQQAPCLAAYGSDFVTASQLCAGYPQGGKDACQGDSGGPAVSASGLQVGIVSQGKGCAMPLLPGIYTRISSYSNFVDSVFAGTASPTAPLPVHSSSTGAPGPSSTGEASSSPASQASSASLSAGAPSLRVWALPLALTAAILSWA